MKKENLEEAAEKYYPSYPDGIITDEIRALREGFVKGYEVQAERMYSEEDMIEFAVWMYLEVGQNLRKERTNKELFKEWFEQFKKK